MNNKQKSYALHRLVIYEFYDVCMYYPKEAMSLFWSISQTFDTSITCEPYKVSNTISLGFKLCSPFLFKLWQRILIHYSMLQIELNTFFKFIIINWYRIAKAWYILKAHAFTAVFNIVFLSNLQCLLYHIIFKGVNICLIYICYNICFS